MSLLNVYVILCYYDRAVPSKKYPGKITKQQFAIDHLESQFRKLAEFKSSAIHWNIEQTKSDNMQYLFDNAMNSYRIISRMLNVTFHSEASALRKISSIASSRDSFLSSSRKAAESAQRRESVTVQLKEKTDGEKETITIRNYLGGEYYLTLDEFRVKEDNVELVEAKHTKKRQLPSWNDIKDGLLKMVLFTNLSSVELNGRHVKQRVVLKLTSTIQFSVQSLNSRDRSQYMNLLRESQENGFIIEHICYS